ncbi:hypothetical protein C8Q75DRAFT_137737 [Abortiporus biennis]|nr:hypothetical protein C8Q75DRAFT_137737 [Abortiporus biennis]
MAAVSIQLPVHPMINSLQALLPAFHPVATTSVNPSSSMAPSPPHISFKSTKFDKLNSVVTDLSSADRIPPEILHTIVQSLTESQSDGFPYDWTFVYHDHKERVEVCRYIQLDILRVTSINRLWYNSALSLLYRKPFLSSIRSLRLFARTVSHSLVLASLVKEIVVLPQDDYFYDSHLDRRGWLHNIIARRRSESVRRHTTTILRHCPSIQTLTADSSVPNLNCGIKSAFERTRVVQPQDVASFGKSIRRLVFRKTPSIFSIDPHKTPIFPGNICQHLPLLEDLCFREIQFPDAYSFPPMLHLRTLQIAQCTHQQNHIRVGTDVIILVSSTLMPSLSSLGLFQNSIRVHVDNQALLGLNILGLIGPAEYDSFVLWCQDQPESLVNIRELTFGTTWYPIIGEDEGYNIPGLENISFDHLQSLTCIVWGYGLGHSDLVEEVSARILLRLTQRLHSMGNFSNSGLRDLEIITIGSSDLDTEFTSVALLISCIHEECIRKGINFHIQEDALDEIISRRLL